MTTEEQVRLYKLIAESWEQMYRGLMEALRDYLDRTEES